MPSCRIIIHPRCLEGPARGALEAVLQERGFDIAATAIGPPNKHKNCDLVRLVARTDTTVELERMDGHRFTHCIAAPQEPGRA